MGGCAVLAAVGLVVSGCAGEVSSGASSAPSSVSAEPSADPTVYPGVRDDPRCAGYTLLPYKVVHYPDGGLVYLFGTARGSGATNSRVAIPPKDFDPLTASDARLERYNFDARPPKGKTRQQTKRRMRHWRREVTELAGSEMVFDGYMCITSYQAS